MKIKSKKAISTLLTFIMFFTLAFNNVVTFASEPADDRTITAKTTASTPTIWIVGDSTVSSFTDNYYYPRYGWGTQIANYLDGSFTIKNLALSGRSSKSYTTDPEYQTLLSGMKSGDYLLIGFGHNDEKTEPERYTNPNGTYLDPGSFANSLYENYIKPAQAAGTQVILSTPIVRRTNTGVWSNSNLHITDTVGEFPGGDYRQAIRDLGTALNVPVVDMTTLTKTLYDELSPSETLYLHAWTSSKPQSVDNTHTNIWGGRCNAYLLTKAIKELGVSGLAEHVINAEAPTKADTLVSNPNYQETPYNGELQQSALWADYGIWKGTVFGDIGGVPSTANQTLETDSDGNMHIAVANNKGKIASVTDGFAMYYYKVPANSTFTLTAKAKINNFSLNDQVSFGLMARDEMHIDSYINTTMGDYVAAAPLKLTKAATGGFWNSFARKSGVLTQGGTAANPISVGDTINLSITSNSDGYATKVGKEATITGGFDFKLTSVDPDYVYVGMFVARNADITFSDIKLVVDGVEVTSADTTAPVTEAAVTPAQPDGLNGWYTHHVELSLNVSDKLSGAAKTEYSFDGGKTWVTYTEPITINMDGKYDVSYRSLDNAGNIEEKQNISINLDSTAPTIDMTGVTNDIYTDSVDIQPAIEPKDNLSGIDNTKTTIALDGNTVENGMTIPLFTLPLGQHEYSITAFDVAGNMVNHVVRFQTSTSIQSLKELITRFTEAGWIDSNGIAKSLKSKLDAENLAAFLNEVQAQRGKHIYVQYADYLTRDAEYLLSNKSR
ncbi:GDSL-type esterase/lipase family protein [Neobacillus sp. 179-C4.2 HS]|uniref:GDSL-type esterase/lipase family protein n=1 Tax=Neobacillus driksii TaxID=3035913 RepID=A0ABV4YUB3_9BACI|nr:GDSL-type esterase/lipase family protein [Neobacillus sp. 179.-C4.2 HS]MDP5192801.1 GDSL-type esterase/lipase family protein [Neobacillus sp. 179.-C4.2 HS]